MPHYLCLIWGGDCVGEPAAQREENGFDPIEGYKFVEGLRQANRFVAASPLVTDAKSTLVSARDGQLSVTDGPFVETKEVLAGFFVIEAANQADAEKTMSQSPHAKSSTIEIKELLWTM